MDVMTLIHEIPDKLKHQDLIQYAESLSNLYARHYDATVRKLKGQFFTPKQVSKYMAGLFEINHDVVRLLDPGAGTGILTAAFCERLLNNGRTIELTMDAYENDPTLLPLLRKTFGICKSELEAKGHAVDCHIYDQDFILSNDRYFTKPDLFSTNMGTTFYDFVISNPPYYKLNNHSRQSSVLTERVSEQPNIYAVFMALCASLVKPEGEMVFITPRSFCSGLYYRRFREWFLDNVQISSIHIFESRKEIFDKDEVLQENVIIKAKKRRETGKQNDVVITTSRNKEYHSVIN
jgi:adenine-specific DNA-methyltransferase